MIIIICCKFLCISVDTPSRTNWEDDEDVTPLKRSSWDLPTPAMSRRDDDSVRSYRSSRESDRRYQQLFIALVYNNIQSRLCKIMLQISILKTAEFQNLQLLCTFLFWNSVNKIVEKMSSHVQVYNMHTPYKISCLKIEKCAFYTPKDNNKEYKSYIYRNGSLLFPLNCLTYHLNDCIFWHIDIIRKDQMRHHYQHQHINIIPGPVTRERFSIHQEMMMKMVSVYVFLYLFY